MMFRLHDATLPLRLTVFPRHNSVILPFLVPPQCWTFLDPAPLGLNTNSSTDDELLFPVLEVSK